MTAPARGYICRVVADRKVYEIRNIIDELSIINPLLHGVTNGQRQRLDRVEIIRRVERVNSKLFEGVRYG